METGKQKKHAYCGVDSSSYVQKGMIWLQVEHFLK